MRQKDQRAGAGIMLIFIRFRWKIMSDGGAQSARGIVFHISHIYLRSVRVARFKL